MINTRIQSPSRWLKKRCYTMFPCRYLGREKNMRLLRVFTVRSTFVNHCADSTRGHDGLCLICEKVITSFSLDHGTNQGCSTQSSVRAYLFRIADLFQRNIFASVFVPVFREFSGFVPSAVSGPTSKGRLFGSFVQSFLDTHSISQ